MVYSDSFLQKTWVSYITSTASLMMIRMSCRDLDSEDMYVQVRCNLIANTDTVANQIKEREDQSNPKNNIFINKAVKILVQKQKCWTYECCVMQMHFTFSHMCHLRIEENQWWRHFHIRAVVSYTVNQYCDQISSFKSFFSNTCWISKTKITTQSGYESYPSKWYTMSTKSP